MLPPCLQHLQSQPEVKEAKLEEISGSHLEPLPAVIMPMPAKSEVKQGRGSLKKARKQLSPPLSTSQMAACPLSTSHLCSVELTISGPASIPLAAAHIFSHQPLPNLLPPLLTALKALMQLPESPASCPLPYCSQPVSSFSSHMRWEHQFELLCCHLVLLGGQHNLISALSQACTQSRVRQFLRFVLSSTILMHLSLKCFPLGVRLMLGFIK